MYLFRQQRLMTALSTMIDTKPQEFDETKTIKLNTRFGATCRTPPLWNKTYSNVLTKITGRLQEVFSTHVTLIPAQRA